MAWSTNMNTTYKLDTIIEADESLCIGCGNCIRTCLGGLVTRGDRAPLPALDGRDVLQPAERHL